MLYVVVNTKGGVGKSVVSGHLLTAYQFHRKNSPVRYVEIDDQNMSLQNIADSSIVIADTVKTESLDSFAMQLVLENEDAIIDVGGNITSMMFLNSINNIGSLRGNAIYFIPMLDSKQDLKNAIDTYNLIRVSDNSSKIVFVLNRAINKNNANLLHEQFIEFFGRKELDIRPAFETITDAYLIALNSDFVYNILARHKKTLIEVSVDDVKESLNEAIAKNRENPESRDEAIKLLYHEKVIVACKKLFENEYIPLFDELRRIEED